MRANRKTVEPHRCKTRNKAPETKDQNKTGST